tara:strand:- start:9734 stop:10012 length:279 start_codon:yes stop_codon:yes gene_type:complete
MRHKTLRRRIIAVLATLNEPITAVALVDRLIETGLSQRYIGNRARVVQILRSTKGVGRLPMNTTGLQGETYTLDGYVLEDEEVFFAWAKTWT